MAYTPVYSMPIIGAPPAGTAPEAYYDAIRTDSEVTVAPGVNEGVTVRVSNAARRQLLAMSGGTVRFLPAGAALPAPAGELSAGGGTLVLEVWAVDATDLTTKLPGGVPVMTNVLYLDVPEAAARAAIQHEVQRIPEPQLRTAWLNGHGAPAPAGASVTDLANDYLLRILAGTDGVFVSGGTVIGEAREVTPGSPGDGVTFGLRFLDGAAVKQNLSPIGCLRSAVAWGGAPWDGHLLLNAVRDTPRPLNVHLQFEVWNLTTHAFEPLHAGTDIDLMDYDSVSGDEPLATQPTDANGRVHFQVSDVQSLDEDEPDLYFRVRTTAANNFQAGNVLPSEWSTRGWQAVGGEQGYYEDFTGVQLGRLDAPLVFRVGLDIHVSFTYQGRSSVPVATRFAPPRLRIDVFAGSSEQARWETDSRGEVHGVLFDVGPGEDINFVVPFYMTDPAINLPESKVEVAAWYTDDVSGGVFHDWDRTSIGSHAAPEIASATNPERNVALFFLKILRELQTFLFHITAGGWTGIPDLRMFTTSASGVPYSWPIGSVNIPPDKHWDRSILIHELTHQVVWKQADYSSLGVGWEAVFGNLATSHHPKLLSNPESALIEGWPEFLAAVFAGPADLFAGYRYAPPNAIDPFQPASYTSVYDANMNSLGTINVPLNRGESVECALAISLLRVYRNFVVTPGVDPPSVARPTGEVPETVSDGDIATLVPWVTNPDVRSRFFNMIWQPLANLAPLNNPTTTDLMFRTEARNPSRWHELRAEFNHLRLAMAPPTVTSITPARGVARTPQPVTIRGTQFVVGATVAIGGLAARSVVVISQTELRADAPALPAGFNDVEVTTDGGTGTLPRGYNVP